MLAFNHAPAVPAPSHTTQPALFAAPDHDPTGLALFVHRAHLQPTHETLDIACGSGAVVAAFAPHVHRAVGVDAGEALVRQAEAHLQQQKGLANAEVHHGNAAMLPFATASFDVVTCRFALHRMREPALVMNEMLRVCRPGGRIVVCDVVPSDNVYQAQSFNMMERIRDPAIVEYRTLHHLRRLFGWSREQPSEKFYRIPVEREALVATCPDDIARARLREMIDRSLDFDRLGMDARRVGDTVHLSYAVGILGAVRGKGEWGLVMGREFAEARGS